MSLISQSFGRDNLGGQDAEAAEPDMALESRKRRKRKQRTRKPKEDDGALTTPVDEDTVKEMKALEAQLFGNLYASLPFGSEFGAPSSGGEQAPLFVVDRAGSGGAVDDGTAVFYEEDLEARKPAWDDEEEELTQVNIVRVKRLRKLQKERGERIIDGKDYVSRLRAQHEKLNPGTEWAKVGRKFSDGDDDESDAEHGEDVLRCNHELVVSDKEKLLPGLLESSKLTDANVEEPSDAPINSVQFHRNGQLLLTAGLDRSVRFFQVDGKRNPKIESIFLENCPARKAAFLPDGSEVVIAGRRNSFYCLDLVKAAVNKIGPLTGREEKSLETFEISPDSSTIAFIGNGGYILLVSSRTKELIGTLKMNGTARSLAFTSDSRQLLSGGGDGHIYHWDLGTRRCIHKGTDEGSLSIQSLCTSPDSTLFASGSTTGTVNVYKRDDFLGGRKKPFKVIDNLTSAIGQMKFNHDAQVLAICSTMKENSLKLAHVPSFTVFSNWPRSNLQYPRCVDFSPGGGFMAIGNAAGKVLLYKLHHYQNA